MVKRATVADVAKAAGVSVATVDRALTGRLPVRRDTAERVAAAANELGFHASGVIAGRLCKTIPRKRVGFLLQRPHDAFYSGFARALETAVSETSAFRGVSTVDYWTEQDPDQIAERIRHLARRADALAVVSPDHPTVTEAVAEAVRGGKLVFSLLSDFAFSARSGYIGADNMKAGRTAAWTIAHGARRPGKVVIFVGSHRFNGHELREIGFRSYFREHAPEFTVAETPATMESAVVAAETMRDLLDRNDELVGCYVAGGGMEGAIASLRKSAAKQKPILVCSASTPDSRAALIDGTVTAVVAEPVEPICQQLVAAVAEAAASATGSRPMQRLVPVELLTPENI